MDISVIEVYKPLNKKIRIGKDFDGGYIIVEGLEYDCFLAAGISDDISFEEDFIKLYPNIPYFAFDGTIETSPSPQITVIKQNIGSGANGTTNFSEYFERYNNIFIKMDIEGHEFPWLASLTTEQIKKIKQFVVEFHYPTQSLEVWTLLDKLRKTHWLVHLHPHNGCGYKTYKLQNGKDIIIPNLFECTYTRKEFLEFNDEPTPSPLDQQNSPHVPELEVKLFGYPYNTLKPQETMTIL